MAKKKHGLKFHTDHEKRAKDKASLVELMMKSGMRLRKLDDDYKAMVMQTIDITD